MAKKSISLKKISIYLFFYFPIATVTVCLICWIYLSSESVKNLITIDEAIKTEFDYIIVGGGTAGCVLANRLTEYENVQVLLIESGGTFGPIAMVPLLASQQQKTSVDWQLRTTSQIYSSFGFVDHVEFHAINLMLNLLKLKSIPHFSIRYNLFRAVVAWADQANLTICSISNHMKPILNAGNHSVLLIGIRDIFFNQQKIKRFRVKSILTKMTMTNSQTMNSKSHRKHVRQTQFASHK